MSTKWWCDFFDDQVAQCILAEPREGEIEFLIEHLGLKPGDRVFDQCCGWGRISGPLSERAFEIWGVDASEVLIQKARSRWSGHYHFGDATSYRQQPLCNAAMNLYSSFGYSADDAYNSELLRGLLSSVKPGGRVILDTINPERVYANFQNLMSYEAACGTKITRVSQLTESRKMLAQDWTFQLKNGQTVKKEGTLTRLYSAHELTSKFRQLGGNFVSLFGDLWANPYTAESERLIVIAEVP